MSGPRLGVSKYKFLVLHSAGFHPAVEISYLLLVNQRIGVRANNLMRYNYPLHRLRVGMGHTEHCGVGYSAVAKQVLGYWNKQPQKAPSPLGMCYRIRD